jgi:CopG family transcriptional regulator / antitoxin EndoAI
MKMPVLSPNSMTKRLNIVLPETTVKTIDRLARPGERSRFIDKAVLHYVATSSPEALHERLKAACIRDRDLSLEIANDWYAVDQEQWQRLEKQEKQATASNRKGAKSTSRRSTRR